MSNDNTITLALDGEVSLDDLEQAMHKLKSLLSALQGENGKGHKLRWIVEEMRGGSAVASFCGIGPMAPVVVAAYAKTGNEASLGRLPSSPAIRSIMLGLTGIIGKNGVTSMRFQTRQRDAEIFTPLSENVNLASPQQLIPAEPAIGSVQGRIQTIASHASLQFTMYDLHTDRSISCYLEPGSEDYMRKAWGKIAVVSGLVRRHPRTGEPTTVRGIRPENIKLVKEIKGSWRDAIGASRSRKGEMPSEIAIRRGRDG